MCYGILSDWSKWELQKITSERMELTPVEQGHNRQAVVLKSEKIIAIRICRFCGQVEMNDADLPTD